MALLTLPLGGFAPLLAWYCRLVLAIAFTALLPGLRARRTIVDVRSPPYLVAATTSCVSPAVPLAFGCDECKIPVGTPHVPSCSFSNESILRRAGVTMDEFIRYGGLPLAAPNTPGIYAFCYTHAKLCSTTESGHVWG